MYSITLTPERDTPEVLAHYAKISGVGPGWTFLTGKPTDIELLRTRLGFSNADPKKDADNSEHTGLLLMGDDAHNWWGTVPSAAGHPEHIVRLIEWLRPNAQGIAVVNR